MTGTSSSTFTRTNARYIASKIAADLRQMSTFYGAPSDTDILDYVEEVVEHLAQGFLSSVEYGFRRDGDWVVSVRYEVRSDGTVPDTGAGRVFPRADLSGATFGSYLIRSVAFNGVAPTEQQAFLSGLTVQRTAAAEPGHTGGYWESGKSYASGGVGAVRTQWRPH